LLFCLSGVPARAERIDTDLVSARNAQRVGLERVWFTQLDGITAPGASGNLQLVVSLDQSQTICLVTDQNGVKYRFSERNLDTFGELLGAEGAANAAAEKVRLLKARDGLAATVETNTVPDIRIIGTTTRGVIHSIDAESGRLLWKTPVGNSTYPTTAAAANDKWVAVVNGQRLYVLQTSDGSVIAERRFSGSVPASNPALTGDTAFVPMLSGQLIAYGFSPEAPSWPNVYYAQGAVKYPPTAIGKRVFWATEKGIVTAASAGQPTVDYRVRLDDPIAGPIVFSPPDNMLVVTTDGYLYCLNYRSGDLIWRYSSGDQTAQPASVVDELVYLVSREAGMQAVSTAAGEQKWTAPTIKQFVSATKTKVYAVNAAGNLVILDIQNGGLLGELHLNPTDRAFVNNQTDRVYVGTHTGIVQCLRETSAIWPTIHVTSLELAPARAKDGTGQGGEAAAADATQPDDPFAAPAAGAKPADAKPAADTPADDDPFGDKPAVEPARKAAGKPKSNPFEDDESGEEDGGEN
jgi:outer membrane protein assembly factor BamB